MTTPAAVQQPGWAAGHRPLAALADISARLSSTLDVPDLVDTVVRQVGQLLPCDGSFLCEFDEDSDALIFRGSHGLPPEVVDTIVSAPPLPRGRGTFSQLAQSSRPLVIDDLEAEGAMRSPFLPWFLKAGYRSMLGVPLMRQGRTMGGLVIFSAVPAAFDANTIDLLSAFAAEVALALKHARLFSLHTERSHILSAALAEKAATNEVLRVMAVSRADSQPVFDTIARTASELCGCEMGAVFGFDGQLIHIRAHHNWDDKGLAAFRAMYPRRPGEPSIVALCVAQRSVVHVPDTETNPQVPQDSLRLTRGLRFRAVVAVPMLLDGEPIGAIGVMRAAPGPFTPGQIALLETFADQAVLALETSRLMGEVQERNREITLHRDRMEDELQLAREIQLGMVPNEFPPPSAARPVEIHATLEPAREIGGDLYDFFWRADGRLCFVVADVSDKGAPAALYMARTKTLIRALALQASGIAGSAMAPSPARILELVNEELCVDNRHTMFVTLFFGMLDPASGELHACNAGHPAPLVVHSNAPGVTLRVRSLVGPICVPLGVSPRSRYAEACHLLVPGDTLFAFTDGITEASDACAQLFGDERLIAALQSRADSSAKELIGAVIAAVRAFVGSAPRADDIAALALRPFAQAPQAPQAVVHLRLPACVESLIEVAAAVDRLAIDHAVPATVLTNMQVVLDEALSNIVTRASELPGQDRPSATIRLWLTVHPDSFAAEIEDDGPAFDPTRPLPPVPTGPLAQRPIGGLGLHLMQRLCHTLEYRRECGMNRLSLSVARSDRA